MGLLSSNKTYFLILLKLMMEYASATNFCDSPMSCSPNSLSSSATNSSEDKLSILDGSNLEEHFDLHRPSYLFCCFSAKPFCPVIRWFKDGIPLSIDLQNGRIIEDNRVVHIFSVRNSDAGVYTCEATTPHNKTMRHTMKVHVQLKCGNSPYVDGMPADKEIEVVRGANQTLQCKVYCYGDDPLATVSWLKEGTQQRITKSSSEYKVDIVADGKSVSGPIKTTTLTIYNFAESANFTCFFEGNKFHGNHVFYLKPKVCEEDVFITSVPSGVDELVVEKGSNRSLQCQFFCLEKELFKEAVWLNENNEPIRNNTAQYIFTRRANYFYKEGRPDYVITITILNITTPQKVTCFLPNGKNNVSNTFQLVLKPACEEDVFITSVPSGVDELVVKKGSNRTLRCQFFCLKKERFREAVWLNENNELIRNNTAQYILTRRANFLRSEGRPDYEITITILNITTSRKISCFLPNGKNNVSTTFQLNLKPEAETRLTEPEVNFFKRAGIWILVACFVVVVALLSSLLLWCKKRVRSWSVFYRPNIKPENDAKYDAFVSFSEADGGAFVRSTLLPMLEDECGYSLSLHYREFIPGTSIVENIADSIDNSRRIITVVTPKFLKSEWCRFEVDQGLRRAVEKPNTLVVIMLDDIPRGELPKTLRHFISKVNFLQWDGGQLEKMREKLSRALGTALAVNTTEAKKPASSTIAVDDIQLSVGNTFEDMNYIGNFKDTL